MGGVTQILLGGFGFGLVNDPAKILRGV